MKSIVFYLEMTAPGEPGAVEDDPGVELREISDAETSARFYREVGADWQWTDRLPWSAAEWREWVARDGTLTLVVMVGGREAGYFELEKQDGGNVEVVYCGLLPEWIGRGLGRVVLAAGVRRAWNLGGTRRVWLHTCTEDHPRALANYQRCGFRIYKTEEEEKGN